MEAIKIPSPHPPISSSFTHHHPIQQRSKQLTLLKEHTHSLPSPSRFLLRAQPLDDALATTILNSKASNGGDLSVLIPISSVLLFVYWIANFVVPNMITKNLASDEEEEINDNAQ